MKAVELVRLAASAALMAVIAGPASASSESITATTSTMPIAIYEDGNGKRKLQDMAVNAFASRLPLTVANENDGYLLVRIDNRDVWVDAAQVRVSRATKSTCDDAKVRIGGTPLAEAGVSRGAGPKANPCAR